MFDTRIGFFSLLPVICVKRSYLITDVLGYLDDLFYYYSRDFTMAWGSKSACSLLH